MSDNNFEQDDNIIDTTMRELPVEDTAVDNPVGEQEEERLRQERREALEQQRAARRAAMQGRNPVVNPPRQSNRPTPYNMQGQGDAYGQDDSFGQGVPYQNLGQSPYGNPHPSYGQGAGGAYGADDGQIPPGGHPYPQKKRENGNSWGIRHYVAIALIGLFFGFMASAGCKGIQDAMGGGAGSTGTVIPTTAPVAKEDIKATDSGTSTGEAVTAQIKDVSGVVDNIMPAIVAINCTVQEQYSIFGQYYGSGDASSSGSGIIVGQSDEELLIATNNHVISDAKSISVQFIDEKVYDAQVKGKDSTADLAVVAVKVKDLTADTKREIKVSQLGDSDSVRVGEVAIAIGNALGYGQSVTVGYISAKDREVSVTDGTSGRSSNKMKLLQTDAAINPGNSGGALLNIKGEVIGINSVKYASEEVEGMGYAIPISMALPIINELMGREDLQDNEKGYLGISGKTVDTGSQDYNMPEGVYVNQVSEGGAAERAGIIKGDIITKINDISVTSMEALQERVNSYRAGTEITITLQRAKEGVYQEQTVTATLQDSKSVEGLQGSKGGNPTATPDNREGGNGFDDYDDYYSNPFGDWFDW